MAIKGPELEIAITANIAELNGQVKNLAVALERVQKAANLTVDIDIPNKAKDKIKKLVEAISKEAKDISSIPIKFTEEGSDALVAKLETTASKLDTVIQKAALMNQHAKEAIKSVGEADATQKIEKNAKAVRELNDEVNAIKSIESDKVLASLDFDKFVKSAKDMVNLIEKITGMAKTLKKETNSIGDAKVDL